MRLHLLGVRGSTPTPGARFQRYGGNTSCVAIENDDGVRLVIDAGTGIRGLGQLTGGRPFDGTILLGHLHWDHTQGLPFCPVIDHPDARVDVHAPRQAGTAVDTLLAGAMSPPNFPIGPQDLRGSWTWHSMDEGTVEIEGYSVQAREIPHKGGRTFGFRITDGSSTMAYLSDHMPTSLGEGADGLGVLHEAATELAADVDVLIHDAQYTAEELPTRGIFGHAAAEYAVSLGRHVGARHVILHHHDPARTDDEIDLIVERFDRCPIVVTAAVEGHVVETGGSR